MSLRENPRDLKENTVCQVLPEAKIIDEGRGLI
jgi:hypothetical protein